MNNIFQTEYFLFVILQIFGNYQLSKPKKNYLMLSQLQKDYKLIATINIGTIINTPKQKCIKVPCLNLFKINVNDIPF